MSKLLFWASLCTIYVPALIALLRCKQIHIIYMAFLCRIWLAATNEAVTSIAVFAGKSVAINNNIYVLLDALVMLWFFSKHAFSRMQLTIPLVLGISLTILWIIENLLFGYITSVSSYFRISYSFVIVLLSISTINNLLSSVNSKIFQNPVFLICVGLIVFYTFKILVEAFWVYGITLSTRFQTVLYNIMLVINIFANLIYALAILWMPKKQIFTMRS